jgi:hypothetical protein
MKFSLEKTYQFNCCVLYGVTKIKPLDADAKEELIQIEGYGDEMDEARFVIRHDRFAAFAASLITKSPEVSEKMNVWLSDQNASDLFFPDICPDEPLYFDLKGIEFQFKGRVVEPDADFDDEVFNLFHEI